MRPLSPHETATATRYQLPMTVRRAVTHPSYLYMHHDVRYSHKSGVRF